MKYVNTVAGFGVVEDDRITIWWDSDIEFYAGAEGRPLRSVALVDTLLLPPTTAPEKIICVGLNYRQHAIEAGMDIPNLPILFPKFANSLVGPDNSVELIAASSQVDYEAELALVIATKCSRVTVDMALSHVAGYCCANDVSARDLQMESSQWLRGKAIDSFLPLGPVLVTPEEIEDPQDLQLRCTVNGEMRQQSSTADMIFSVAELISFISTTCTLMPGDIVVTGTPAGVGMGFNPPKWLSAGDQVEIDIGSLGILRTKFVGGAA